MRIYLSKINIRLYACTYSTRIIIIILLVSWLCNNIMERHVFIYDIIIFIIRCFFWPVTIIYTILSILFIGVWNVSLHQQHCTTFTKHLLLLATLYIHDIIIIRTHYIAAVVRGFCINITRRIVRWQYHYNLLVTQPIYRRYAVKEFITNWKKKINNWLGTYIKLNDATTDGLRNWHVNAYKI